MGRDSNGNGALFFRGRPDVDVINHHHDRWSADGRHIHEHIVAGDNMTHTTDAYAREAVRMILEHPVAAAGQEQQPLFVFIPFTAPHWPTQFWQHHVARNMHIPGQKRREFAAMITHIDDAMRSVVEALKRKGFWDNSLLIGFADNGGDIRTGASNWPYRGTKATCWEGGTKAASFVHSPNPALIPPHRRGTESHTLAHVSDWSVRLARKLPRRPRQRREPQQRGGSSLGCLCAHGHVHFPAHRMTPLFHRSASGTRR